jgi:hypothetical protein
VAPTCCFFSGKKGGEDSGEALGISAARIEIDLQTISDKKSKTI